MAKYLRWRTLVGSSIRSGTGIAISKFVIFQSHKIPDEDVEDFRFSLEYHFGGCGVIELSNDWPRKAQHPIQATSVALGFKFCESKYYLLRNFH